MANDTDWSRTAILLLKTPSTPTDDYSTHFAALTRNHFVPVLEHVYNAETIAWLRTTIEASAFTTNASTLELQEQQHQQQQQHQQRFSGLIFTSQRAVEAFSQVISALDAAQRGTLLQPDLPLYVVGPATARSLRSLGLKCSILGEDSGNGASLADYILAHHRRSDNPSAPRCSPLLFLVGEQRRDVIPKTLQSADLPETDRIGVVEKVVYESRAMDSMPSDLARKISLAVETGVQRIWIVVFSPTGCKVLLNVIRGRSDVQLGDASSDGTRPAALIVTIGPTTRDFLRRECDFEPQACADEPSPAGIERAVRAFKGP